MKKLIFILMVITQSMFGATYYVDLDGGDDTLAGTAQGTAWKTIPGTRNTADSAYVSASYGPAGATINTTDRVQAGDTFMLKSGTVHDSTDGGKVFITSTYYVTTATTTGNPITIKRDTNWGSGSVEFNGTGMTLGGGGFGLIHITVGGIVIDGVSGTNGIIIAKSPYNGISAYPLVDIQGPTIRNVFFGTNGTTYTPGTDDASEGNIHLLRSYGGTIADCVIMGGGSSYQGMCFGESHRACWDYIVTNCTVADMNGNDDGGIGFKPLNSQFTFIKCSSTGCYKGVDGGEINGDGSNIVYRINGFTSVSNMFGINLNGSGLGAAYTGTIDFYIYNSIIGTNAHGGVYIYSGAYNCYIVHNTFYANGKAAGFTDGNIRIENDVERGFIDAYVLNNIFYKPFTQNYYNHYFDYDVTSDGLSLFSDYNSWIQGGSEQFAQWAGSNPATNNNSIYLYGTNGPGHASGNWWQFYSGNTTAPTNGRLGHFHADAHSVGTGADVTTAPSFWSYPTDLRISQQYSGTNISSRTWFSSDMGIDRSGTTRSSWDIGAFEFQPFPPTARIGHGRNVPIERP